VIREKILYAHITEISTRNPNDLDLVLKLANPNANYNSPAERHDDMMM